MKTLLKILLVLIMTLSLLIATATPSLAGWGWFNRQKERVSNATQNAKAWVSEKVKQSDNAIKGGFKYGYQKFGEAADGAKPYIMGAGAASKKVIDPMADAAKPYIMGVGKASKDVIDPMADAAKPTFDSVGKATKDVIDPMADGFKPTYDNHIVPAGEILVNEYSDAVEGAIESPTGAIVGEIPILGDAVTAGDVAGKAGEGDYTGAGLEAAGGVAGAVAPPGGGFFAGATTKAAAKILGSYLSDDKEEAKPEAPKRAAAPKKAAGNLLKEKMAKNKSISRGSIRNQSRATRQHRSIRNRLGSVGSPGGRAACSPPVRRPKPSGCRSGSCR